MCIVRGPHVSSEWTGDQPPLRFIAPGQATGRMRFIGVEGRRTLPQEGAARPASSAHRVSAGHALRFALPQLPCHLHRAYRLRRHLPSSAFFPSLFLKPPMSTGSPAALVRRSARQRPVFHRGRDRSRLPAGRRAFRESLFMRGLSFLATQKRPRMFGTFCCIRVCLPREAGSARAEGRVPHVPRRCRRCAWPGVLPHAFWPLPPGPRRWSTRARRAGR